MNRTKIEEMAEKLFFEHNCLVSMDNFGNESVERVLTKENFIKALTSLLAEDGGEVKECQCGIDEMTFGSRMNGYDLEIITKRMYQDMSPENRWYVTVYDFCSSCGGKIEASQHTKGEGV